MTCVNAKTLSITLLAGVPLVFTACGGDSLTLPSEGQPAHIVIEQGSGQQARVGTTLDTKLMAKVTDSQDRPVAGTTVQFVLDNNLGDGQVDPASGTTDGNGEVTATLKLGSQVGEMSGKAQVPVADGAAPIEAPFTAQAVPANASGIAMFSGDGQSGPVGSTLSDPLVVKVTDAFGNPISGITVHWSAEGQGSVSDDNTVTGDDGQTSVTRTLGPNAGQQTTLASADGLAGSPVTFTSTANAGNASRIEIVSGDGQQAPAGTQLPQDLVVRVLDQDGNPVTGRPVQWVIGKGGGTVNPETSQTNSQGQASTKWILGSAPDSNTVNAVVPGIGSALFHATATGAGSPSNLAVTTQPPTPVVIGATMSPGPVAQVRDAAGHDLAVAGVNVTAALQGHGQLTGTTTVATDGNGRAQFNDLRVTGSTGSYKLLFAADGYRSATSDKFDVVKAGTTTNVDQGNPQPSDPGQAVTFTFSVTPSSPGTPTGNVQVKASDSEQCTAPVSQGSCSIIFTGTGDRAVTATYSGDDVFAGSSGTATHHVNEPLPPPNTPPVASDDHYSTSPGASFHVPGDAGFGLLANDADLDNDPLSVTTETVVTSQGVTVNIAPDGSFDYTAPAAPTDADTFSYSITDGRGGTSTATVTISFGG
jgi:Bacterial Ig domain/Bacterial Ig-like domain (group 1)